MILSGLRKEDTIKTIEKVPALCLGTRGVTERRISVNVQPQQEAGEEAVDGVKS